MNEFQIRLTEVLEEGTGLTTAEKQILADMNINTEEEDRGYIVPKELRLKRTLPNCKKVRCIETGIVYPSLKEAALGVNHKASSASNIARQIKGDIVTALGYTWAWEE